MIERIVQLESERMQLMRKIGCLMDQVLTGSCYYFALINIRKIPAFSPSFTPHPTTLADPEPSEALSASI